MTQEQLQDALGMINDDLIESVDKLRQQRDRSHAMDSSNNNILQGFRKKIIRREVLKWGSLAASICLLVGVGFLWKVGGNTTADLANEADIHYSKQENAEAILEDKKNGTQSPSSDKPFEVSPETSTTTSPETAPASISSPPDLYIVTEEADFVRAMRGTYSWHWPTEEGTMMIEADSYHPLQSQKFLTLLETAGASVQLQFDTSIHGEPYAVSVQCWSDEYWDQISVDGLPLTVTDGQIPLQEGGTIYQVQAKWSSGVAYYAFYVYYTPK